MYKLIESKGKDGNICSGGIKSNFPVISFHMIQRILMGLLLSCAIASHPSVNLPVAIAHVWPFPVLCSWECVCHESEEEGARYTLRCLKACMLEDGLPLVVLCNLVILPLWTVHVSYQEARLFQGILICLTATWDTSSLQLVDILSAVR